MSYFKRKRNISGVTLVELLVVVTILVFLMSVIIWYFRNQIFKGNDAKRKGDIHNIEVAIEEYEKDNNCYPLPSLVVCDPGTDLKPYMSKVPCDPMTDASYYYEHEDSSCPSWYRIYTNLDNLTDIDILGECGPDHSFNYYESSPNAPDADCVETGNGGENGTDEDFYGCYGGGCQPINWDPTRPGPQCDPSFKSGTCYGLCTDPDTGQPINPCQPWQ